LRFFELLICLLSGRQISFSDNTNFFQCFQCFNVFNQCRFVLLCLFDRDKVQRHIGKAHSNSEQFGSLQARLTLLPSNPSQSRRIPQFNKISVKKEMGLQTSAHGKAANLEQDEVALSSAGHSGQRMPASVSLQQGKAATSTSTQQGVAASDHRSHNGAAAAAAAMFAMETMDVVEGNLTAIKTQPSSPATFPSSFPAQSVFPQRERVPSYMLHCPLPATASAVVEKPLSPPSPRCHKFKNEAQEQLDVGLQSPPLSIESFDMSDKVTKSTSLRPKDFYTVETHGHAQVERLLAISRT
jgi:hypothetical protein